MDTKTLQVVFKGDTKDLERAIGDVDKKSRGLKDSFANAQEGSFMLMGGLVAAGVAATAFGVASMNAYNASVEASTKLKTNILNVKGATEENVESLELLANQLQKVGVVEDDVIKSGMSQLATFNLQSSTIAALTPKIADMATQLYGHNVQSEQMVQLNNLVGKVMTGNVGALSRYGVTLSENQKQLLSQGSEAQRAAVLNEVLAQNFGKVNEALRNTPQGQMTAFKNTFGDFMELVGEWVSNLVTPLISGFNDWFESIGGPEGAMNRLEETMIAIQPYFPVIAGAIVGGLVPAFVAMGAAIWSAMAPLLPFIAAGAALGLLAKILIDRFGGVDNVLKSLRPAIEWFKNAWNAIATIWNSYILPALKMLYEEFQAKLLPALQEFWQKHGPAVMEALKAIAIVIGVVLLVAIGSIIASIYIMINVWTLLVNAVTWVADMFKNIWNGTVNSWNMTVNAIKQGIDNFVAFFSNLPQNIGFIIGSVIRWFMELPNNVANMVNTVSAWLSQLPGRAYNFMVNMVNTIQNWLSQLPGRAQGAAVGLINGFIGVINGLPGMVANIFNNVVNTVSGWAGQLFNRARDIAGKFWEGFKQGLGIRSPSYIEKAFMAIGNQSTETLTQMSSDLNKLNQISFGTFSPMLGNGMAGGGGVVNNTSATNNTIEVNIAGSADKAQVRDGLVEGLRFAQRGV